MQIKVPIPRGFCWLTGWHPIMHFWTCWKAKNGVFQNVWLISNRKVALEQHVAPQPVLGIWAPSYSFLSFPREHFPFFQTAPDGWKNTIRHNLCFNSSFRKTCNQLYRDGKRKSCFWHLTLDGHRRLKDELRTLTGESFKQLERSMSHPGECENINLRELIQ